jgi:hypothetical protein
MSNKRWTFTLQPNKKDDGLYPPGMVLETEAKAVCGGGNLCTDLPQSIKPGRKGPTEDQLEELRIKVHHPNSSDNL